MPSATDNPVYKEEVVVVEIEPPVEVNNETLIFAIPFLLKCIGHYIVSLLEGLRRISWMDYYPRIFGGIMLPSPLKFIIICLAAFAEMKSQGLKSLGSMSLEIDAITSTKAMAIWFVPILNLLQMQDH